MAGRAEFRKSQGVVPFGVGSIIDFPDDSLMMAGLDAWPSELADGPQRAQLLHASRIVDGRLARRLSVNLNRRIDYFLSPAEAPEPFSFASATISEANGFMPFVRFPTWHFCPRCRVLNQVPWNAPVGDKQLRCANPSRRVAGNAKPCSELSRNRQPRMAPVRFVIACERGHIGDFPWIRWAHGKGNSQCPGGSGELYLYSTPAAGLAGVVVQCMRCSAKRTMAGAFQKDAIGRLLGEACAGDRPWLGPEGNEPGCPSVPQTIQRGASNAYFAKMVSSILIPPYSIQMQQVLDRPEIWDEIQSVRVDGKIPELLLRTKAKYLGFDAETFIKAVYERLSASDSVRVEVGTHISEEDYRGDEYRAFLGARPPKGERQDFDKLERPVAEYGQWFAGLFERVVLIQKLRETRVLTGFSRIVPPEATDGAIAQLSLRPKAWLPAFEVRGEGVVLIFSRARLQEWASTTVQRRTQILGNRLNDHRRDRQLGVRPVSDALVLIHSFAHLLIRQLAFECGYDSSDLRERLYVSGSEQNPMHGVLIYTASGDAEGTLGGLVRQGEPGRLQNTVRAAIENADMCSSDPLCIESQGQGTRSLNLAACHACSLLPETSCEEGNLLLDRALIVGTPAEPTLGYFAGLETA